MKRLSIFLKNNFLDQDAAIEIIKLYLLKRSRLGRPREDFYYLISLRISKILEKNKDKKIKKAISEYLDLSQYLNDKKKIGFGELTVDQIRDIVKKVRKRPNEGIMQFTKTPVVQHHKKK